MKHITKQILNLSLTSRTFLVAFILAVSTSLSARTLEVGPGKRFTRIEEANDNANPNDLILIHPRTNNRPYDKVAVFVLKKNLTFKAMPLASNKKVVLTGKGFEYSGKGSTPRALFQFNKGADNCTLEGFELTEAHNKTHNGAGVRINQANHVTIRNCNIHNNDMGIMSNGDGTQKTALNQVIENCVIHNNGSHKKPGYNHNLYLGGTSVTLRFCDIHHSLTGHNVKSRAHHTRVLYSYIHDSANREFDLVDAKDTEKKNSHAVLMGNVIVKAPKCKGNRGVIHFGQDGNRKHNGTIFLVHNTIVTPFISPILVLSTKKAKGIFIGNFVSDGGTKQSGQRIAGGHKQGNTANVSGTHNWFDRGFVLQKDTALSSKKNYFSQHITSPFVNQKKHDYRPKKPLKKGISLKSIKYPLCPGDLRRLKLPLAWEYVHPANSKKRKMGKLPTLGAHEKYNSNR